VDEDIVEVSPASDATAIEIRCPCGSLLVRRTPDGFEIKCRRCKRTLLLRFPHRSGSGELQ
jgi:hypothetical protein